MVHGSMRLRLRARSAHTDGGPSIESLSERPHTRSMLGVNACIIHRTCRELSVGPVVTEVDGGERRGTEGYGGGRMRRGCGRGGPMLRDSLDALER